VDLVELDPDDPRFVNDALPVLCELRPDLSAAAATAIYDEGYPQGLRFSAVYVDGACRAVAGWRLVANTSATRKLYVDDLVTTETWRSRGIGAFLLAALTEKAAGAGCTVIDLDSGRQRTAAHRFYQDRGMTQTAFHFTRRLD
jgi:GNAT superfamily N-acetyltransferase